MPAIAEFNGITLYIYYPPREHPPPHFHAIYGDQDASFAIETLEVTAGRLRRPQRKAVTDWGHPAGSTGGLLEPRHGGAASRVD